MGTPLQNLTQTITGLMGGTAPTQTQLDNVAAAFFYRMTDDDAMAQFGYVKASMTNANKYHWANASLRRYLKQYVLAAGVDATNDANAAAAAAAGNANAGGL